MSNGNDIKNDYELKTKYLKSTNLDVNAAQKNFISENSCKIFSNENEQSIKNVINNNSININNDNYIEENNDNCIEEKKLINQPDSIPFSSVKRITNLSNNICKIIVGTTKQGTGFFCKFPFPNSFHLLPALITNKHVLDEKSVTK